MRRIVMIILGSICTCLGAIGVFVPVLPTTPFLLLAAFLFSRSSQRLDAWLKATKVYRAYVEPFWESGGLSLSRKVSIIGVSFAIMGISAFLVQRWYVWLVLGAVAVWLIYLMFVRIPTVSHEAVVQSHAAAEEELERERERECAERGASLAQKGSASNELSL